MAEQDAHGRSNTITRREFVRSAAATAAGAAALAAAAHYAHAAGSDKIRVGLVGCGRRGRDAIKNCLDSSPGVEVVALGDLFPGVADALGKGLAAMGEKCKVAPDRCFSGFDNYKKVIACDIDLVLLCAPPGFRPAHLAAALEAGRHVFMEKPVGVDPAGIRSVLASAEVADRKKLGVVAGTQRRHQAAYVETIKRLHQGAIGDVTAGHVYWMGDYSYYPAVERQAGWADMEWQVRNWNYFTWLSGDHIVEQHVHNIDVMCWVMKGPPRKCIGVGGRQQQTAPEFGHIYDHFAVEFEYDGGVRWASYCRQSANCSNRVSEHVAGTKGMSNCAGYIGGPAAWNFQGEQASPYVQEHADLIAGIRAGRPLNECRTVAESTLAAVMGRMAAYTGREINYSWVLKESKLDLMPPALDLGASLPPVEIAVPGKTLLV
ncbi:MAG: Gfo/Idh/MocA family oxidoreductase [Planctomycetes bacterium]|nr:Gfo/Idh/MocA family oxidoreductase [Planctomycetota bacterium]